MTTQMFIYANENNVHGVTAKQKSRISLKYIYWDRKQFFMLPTLYVTNWEVVGSLNKKEQLPIVNYDNCGDFLSELLIEEKFSIFLKIYMPQIQPEILMCQ